MKSWPAENGLEGVLQVTGGRCCGGLETPPLACVPLSQLLGPPTGSPLQSLALS